MSKHEHAHEVQSTIDEIVGAMSSKGWRITDQRKSLAALFAGSEGYQSPKDVYEHMRQKYPGVSFDTVYRNLRLLSEMGVLEQIYLNDGLKFRARCQTHHHHHLICLRCEKTIPFEFCPMKQVPGLPDDFQIVNHRFEVLGYCGDCSQSAGAPSEEPAE
ncbi:Fur family transcriptional regulator [Paenibacillus mucilaginosus]|uniref:Ferric-uptake regulator n=1 Tax=Paenibacillus mucilaginosus (strain KNP414) TaxID=1036673 RepID=F8F8M7_PAEMK|nr:Fur family transcriptional regulator [Paenibacillus mucilaginosus]AEI41615.1 ferric-uptake regulator [Paenibacillus mucilaginosus KNP414]MCG7214319.1 transcriptional repressor [Paenibacillus mucilaginosus]WDM30607.1 transcriptional repressor [Paenibacillus mucilaginosus]